MESSQLINKPSRFKINLDQKNLFLFGVLGVTVCLIIGLSVGIVLSQDSKDGISSIKRANELLDFYPLIDAHNDYIWIVRKHFKNQFDDIDFHDMNPYRQFISDGLSHTDIKRIREGKLGAQFWAVYTNCESLHKDALRIHLEQLDAVKRLIRRYPDDMEFVTSTQELTKAVKNKKIASLLGLESGHAIDSSLAALRNFYRLGVRYMTLTHNCDVPWASNNLVDRYPNASLYGGLTDFGKKVIEEMNRIGMIVDISHVSYQTMLDVLEHSKAPVIFSHSSAYTLCNHTRNVRDDVLKKLKENNGTIMINFYTQFINCDTNWKKTNISSVVDHINYVKDLIGVDHIGIGSDYDGVPNIPIKLDDVSKYPNLVAELIDNGWSERDIVKVVHTNIMRVFTDVEEYSKNQAKMEPIEELLPEQLQPKECYSTFDF